MFMKIYSVALIKPGGVEHCDLSVEEDGIAFECFAERIVGRGRRGLSRRADNLIYSIMKKRREGKSFKIKREEIACWRIEDHRERGVGREYKNTYLVLLRLRNGQTIRFFVTKKVERLVVDFKKVLKRWEIERCKTT